MVATYKFNKAIPGGDRHVVPFATSTCLDVLNLLDQTSPLLSFTQEEHELGQQLLQSLGVGSDPFVCVIVRDEAYYKVALPDRDLSYHSFRNCDIDSYVEGLEALAEKGLFVLRMGAIVEKPLRSSHPKLIDYASSSFRSEFGDVYLGANCKFCISDGLGYYAIPAAFRRPNAYVNYSPFHIFYSSRSCDAGITKVFSDSKSGRVIPIRELHEFNVSELTRSERLAEVGLTLIDNSPSEIRDLILEVNSRLDGTWVANPEDEALQSVFWERYLEAIGPIGRTKHGYIRSRFGAQFLRSHREWIA
jgi:putative glycosyltransferase (TIGR04372 family)